MKALLALAIIATASFTASTSAHAGDYRSSHHQVDYCKPYVVCTHKLYSCQEKRTAYDHCGRPYCYYVTVVTYKDVYNTGYSRTYTKTFRA